MHLNVLRAKGFRVPAAHTHPIIYRLPPGRGNGTFVSMFREGTTTNKPSGDQTETAQLKELGIEMKKQNEDPESEIKWTFW